MDRERALAISRGLFQAAEQVDAGERRGERLEGTVRRSVKGLEVDYATLASQDTMVPIDELDRVRLVRHHWFAGTGMAHGLRLRGGKAEWFRSRFVIDRDAAKTLNRPPIPGPGEGTRDGNVNTSLMNVGGKLCAVFEAGSLPVELDYELASVRTRRPPTS